MRLHNYRKESKQNKNAVLACRHFQNLNHNLNHKGCEIVKFTLIEQIKKLQLQLQLLLKKRGNFRILNLKTLYPDGLNQELNGV